ncbi:MAG: polyprenyl synthetase family protein [bacterium]
MHQWQEFNQSFKKYCIETLKNKLSGLDKIYEICVYPFEVSGKFFRPFLLYKTAEFIDSNKTESMLPFCLALELIHNYSLIHDDLPCMDNADFRRGFPTVHKKFGEAEAVLAGDMLLTLAFEIISSCSGFQPEKIVKVIKKVSQYSSYRYLITGQYLDLWFQKGIVQKNLENIKLINFYKTSGLIMLAVEIPIILLDPLYSIKFKLVKYGYWLGILFQVTDDILDNDGIVEIVSIEEARDIASKIYNKIRSLELSQDLLEIANFVYSRGF